jgi:hypothetical protein
VSNHTNAIQSRKKYHKSPFGVGLSSEWNLLRFAKPRRRASVHFDGAPQCLNPSRGPGKMEERGIIWAISLGAWLLPRPWSSNSLSQEEVKNNALDDFCNSVGFVAGRFSVELHVGWLHSLVARAGDHCSGD